MADSSGKIGDNGEFDHGGVGATQAPAQLRQAGEAGQANDDRETPVPTEVVDVDEVGSSSDAPIFVSYRLEPDEETAVALQRLLSGSFDPPAKIFVASAGGLRPDNLGLNPQLQRAVQQARAFVALITPESRNRADVAAS